MPWKAFHEGDEWCVYKLGDDHQKTGSSRGCHPSEDQANEQVRALYANAAKEIEETLAELAIKESWDTATINDLPDSAFLFIEPGCDQKGCRHLPYKNASGQVDLPHLRNALSRLGQEGTGEGWVGFNRETVKAKAEKILAANSSKELGSAAEPDAAAAADSLVARLVEGLKSVLKQSDDRSAKQPASAEAGSDMLIFKDAGGAYQVVTRYSNRFRDNDNKEHGAEIIADQSHRKFARLVEVGLVSPPDLQLWHIPDWTIGKGLWAAYDDSGFAMAGHQLPAGADSDRLVEELRHLKDVRVSHGMPKALVKRDPRDPSVIVEHVTTEVSLLPGWAAANKNTSAYIIDKENDMALSKEQKESLVRDWGISPETIAFLETQNRKESDALQAAGVESKEKEAPPSAAPASGSDPAGREVAEALGEYLKETMSAVAALGLEVRQLKAQLADLVQADAEKMAVKAAQTPLASALEFMRKSVVDDPATAVDGRSSLARSGPKEIQPAAPQISPFPWVNEMVAGRQATLNGQPGGEEVSRV